MADTTYYASSLATKGGGSNDGTFANPYHIDELLGNVSRITHAIGDRFLLINDGTYYPGEQCYINTNGSNAQPLIVIPAESTNGYPTLDEQVILDYTGTTTTNAAFLSTGTWTRVLNVKVESSSADGIRLGGSYSIIFGCVADNCAANGISSLGAQHAFIAYCSADNNTGFGIGNAGSQDYHSVWIYKCAASGNTGYDIRIGSTNGYGAVLDSITEMTDDTGVIYNAPIYLRGGAACLDNSIVMTTGSGTSTGLTGIGSLSRSAHIIANNIISNVYTGIGLTTSEGGTIHQVIGRNIFHNITGTNVDSGTLSGTSTVSCLDADGAPTTDPDFVDTATQDFTPQADLSGVHYYPSIAGEDAHDIPGAIPTLAAGTSEASSGFYGPIIQGTNS